MFESGVYFGLATDRRISNKILYVASMLPANSIKYSYSWVLNGLVNDTLKPPHITLLPRTLTNSVLDEALLNSLSELVGKAVFKGTGFTLIPFFDTDTNEVIARPIPNSLDCDVLRAMTELLIDRLGINPQRYSTPHMKLFSIDEKIDRNQGLTLNTLLSAIPIYFYPCRVYSTYQDPSHRSKGIFSISQYHKSIKPDSMQPQAHTP